MFIQYSTNRRFAMIMLQLFILLLIVTACSQKQVAGEQLPVSDPSGQSDQSVKIRLLNETARQMNEYMRLGDPVEARNKLLAISDQVTQIQFEGMTSVEGLNALTALLVEAKGIFASVHFQMDEARIIASKIHLAIDALSHKNEPMWMQHDKAILGGLAALERSVQDGNINETNQQFLKLLQQYDLIRPALLIVKPPEEVERTDSLFRFMQSYLQSGNKMSLSEQLLKGIVELRRSFGVHFGRDDASAYLPFMQSQPKRPVMWSATIGLCIVLVLSYVAWRRFGTDHNTVWIYRKKD